MLQLTKYLNLIIDHKKESLVLSSLQRFNNMPPVVVWNINNKCNMTCPHCYSSAKINPIFDGITTNEAYYIIDKLKKYGISIIIFSGGEPLLRDDFFLLADYAKNKGIRCHLSTNGTLITKDIAKDLKSVGIGYVGVSIDGLPLFNDQYRGLKDGFNMAMSGIINARDAGLMTGIRLTVTSINKDYLFPLIDIAVKNGISRFYVSHLLYGGRGKNRKKYDLSAKENRLLMISLFKKAIDLINNGKTISLVCGGNDADNVFLYFYIRDNFGINKADSIYNLMLKRGGNPAGEKIINIDNKANVHPDQFWQTSTCGNILKESLETILNHKLFIELKNRVHNLKGRCKSCVYIDICRGSHRERAINVYNDLWEDDPACYLYDKEISSMAYAKEG